MKNYSLTNEDFLKCVEFSLNYFLEPNKITTGRTSGEPRGLGAILDAFSIGKLTEIGVKNILRSYNSTKDYELDFTIKKTSEITEDPDIVGIKENGKIRKPNIFIEIKNSSYNGRWLGLTEEQSKSMENGANGNEIYIINASIISKQNNGNPKSIDLTGMFLKHLNKNNEIFKKFADLNGVCNIDFIFSLNDLKKHGYYFKKGMNFYETEIFKKKNSISVKKGDGSLVKNVKLIKTYTNFNSSLELKLMKGKKPENTEISTFKVKGNFNLYDKNKNTIIECLSDVELANIIFGEYKLSNGEFYSFNLETVGRDPELKRNNYFISKKRLMQLINENEINSPEQIIKKIVNKI